MNDEQRVSDSDTKREVPSGWGMSEERAFIENLLSERFNFFLVFFSLVIAGVFSARATWQLWIILPFGTVICFLLSLTLFRSQQKLDLIIHKLFEDDRHPAKNVDQLSIDRSAMPKFIGWLTRGSQRRLIGYWIPLLCVLFLVILLVLAALGIIQPAASES